MSIHNTLCRLSLWAVALIAAACARNGVSADTADAASDDLAPVATLLDMRMQADSTYLVKVINPWDTTLTLQAYHLVPRGIEATTVPIEGATRVLVPLSRSIIFSSVHAGAIEQLGAVDSIKGVAEARYFNSEAIRRGVTDGRVADVGSAMTPSVERIVALSPDAILTSPYQNAGYGAIEQLGVPIIEMADYMEPTPQARAEWLRFIGLLYGQSTRADSLYEASMAEYDHLASLVASPTDRPVVITEAPVNGFWMMPGGKSYKARMLADAGARYPWADDTSAGSLQLDVAQVYDKAHNADFWLTTTYGTPMTLAALTATTPMAAKFKAVTADGVYNVDTAEAPLFDEFPFHPELLLADYIAIFHPEAMPGYKLRYFSKVTN